jgi:hypothetical protein
MDTPQHETDRVVDAWILSVARDRRAAVGAFEVVHVLTHSPVLFHVPLAPAHCRTVMLWEDRLLPVVDLHALITNGEAAVEASKIGGLEQLIAVVAYEPDPQQPPEFGALLLASLPERASVGNVDACDLDESVAPWAPIALSLFRHAAYGAIPVLDLRRVFRPTGGGVMA